MSVHSRHRLPEPFRSLLVGLWLTPATLMLLTLIHLNGLSWAVFHPITLLALLAMSFPAWYVWNEGIDVTEKTLRIRITGWRVRSFDQLDTWHLDRRRDDSAILTVWDHQNHRVIHTHATHLTDLPVLLRTLKSRVRERGWHR
jgi:hypothetical protein